MYLGLAGVYQSTRGLRNSIHEVCTSIHGLRNAIHESSTLINGSCALSRRVVHAGPGVVRGGRSVFSAVALHKNSVALHINFRRLRVLARIRALKRGRCSLNKRRREQKRLSTMRVEMKRAALTVAVTVLVVSGSTQTVPDFSGVWRLDTSRSESWKIDKSDWRRVAEAGDVLAIQQFEREISIELQRDGHRDALRHRFDDSRTSYIDEYAWAPGLRRRKEKPLVGLIAGRIARSRWNGDALVTATTRVYLSTKGDESVDVLSLADNTTTTVERRFLAEAGRVMVVETFGPGGGFSLESDLNALRTAYPPVVDVYLKQAIPDFAGAWKLDVEATRRSERPRPRIQQYEIAIRQDSNEITIENPAARWGRQAVAYALDGKEAVIPDNSLGELENFARNLRIRATWDGKALTIRTTPFGEQKDPRTVSFVCLLARSRPST